MPTKHIERIPLPAEFIEPMGEAIGVCQYLDGTLLAIGQRLDAGFYSNWEGETSGRLAGALRKTVKNSAANDDLKKDIKDLCGRSFDIFARRDAIVHSRSYTKDNGEQGRLYRKKADQPYTFLSVQDVDDLKRDAAALAIRAGELLHALPTQ